MVKFLFNPLNYYKYAQIIMQMIIFCFIAMVGFLLGPQDRNLNGRLFIKPVRRPANLRVVNHSANII